MRIAVITEDGRTVSQDLDRAPYYLVLTAEDDEIVDCELRGRPGNLQSQVKSYEDSNRAVARDRYTCTAGVIADCQVLLCRGMSLDVYEDMQARGIRPVISDIVPIDQAVFSYLDGEIADHVVPPQ
ncbi:MAG: hypothetical protein JW730_19565 [Anaerolineales bacterium]|nr:hypothetical protein [Anaerolineales bacterium]